MAEDKTILVIDDEEMIRNVITRMLKTRKFAGIEARNGEEAIRLLETHKETIRFALLDLSMPGMSGEETFKKLKSIKPNLPIVISTGYISTELKNDLMNRGALKIMEKPFEMKELLNLISDTI